MFLLHLAALVLAIALKVDCVPLVAIFTTVEFLLIIAAVVHAFLPVFEVVLTIIGVDILVGLAKIVCALFMSISDDGFDCTKTTCRTFNLTETERFCTFWLLLASATFDHFFALVVLAHSPQLRMFESDEKYH
ncbi:unnamed protein product [Caenorhabditis auriculariae]|uniref:MARVEL domain-containing protein n=1 Tax=Caenorhabditis auriculariae TaxID=2777116 RepID=A0A8S1GYK9_9PELO|nr:unnamed protein product [Caenorhabditis auriculariae]